VFYESAARFLQLLLINKQKGVNMNPQYFFCPNSKCTFSENLSQTERWYKKHGFHQTKAFGNVQRYKCLNCGKTFSDQTFLLNYFLKIKTDFKKLMNQFNSNNSSCFIARENKMSFESVRIRRDRLARNALFLQSKALEGIKIKEVLAADGFESYTRSRYYPVNINILVGSESDFLYYFTESHSRRKGKTTEDQKRKMKHEYEDKSFSGCTLASQVKTLLSFLKFRCKNNKCILNTDEHKTYVSVLKRLAGTEGFPEVIHNRTSSKKPRTGSNPNRSVNYMDKLFRKDIANHRRKTSCCAKNDRNMLSRMSVYMVSHNFFKPRRVSDKARQTEEKHYTALGLDEHKLSFWKNLFREFRFFGSKVELPEYFGKVWKRISETPFGENWYPLPKFAMQ
jgi:aspartate carbamoyltransferase regulatory subunit